MNWIDVHSFLDNDAGVKISDDLKYILTYSSDWYETYFLTEELLPLFIAAISGLPIPKKELTVYFINPEYERPLTLCMKEKAPYIEDSLYLHVTLAHNILPGFTPKEIKKLIRYIEEHK